MGKGKSSAPAPSASTSSAKPKLSAKGAKVEASQVPAPLSAGSDPEDSDFLEDDEEEGSDEESGSEEEDDVTDEAMKRMMDLLDESDLDDAEKAVLLQTLGGEDAESGDESGSDEEEEEEEEDLDSDDEVSDVEGEGVEELEALSDAELDDEADIVPVEKTTVNDQAALLRVLERIKQPTTFLNTLAMTYPTPLNIADPNDDLTRELEFYKQSLYAATSTLETFTSLSLPFFRPADYFAEMLKTDAHMSGIRQKLLDEQAGIKASEDARKLRDAKKFGKKVQVEKLKERVKSKKEMGERVESLKKKRKNGDAFGSTEDFEVALEDAISGRPTKKAKVPESQRGGRGGKISRTGRNAKFGFSGGKAEGGRRAKENNDKRDGDAFSAKNRAARGGGRGGARGGGRGGGAGRGRGGAQRLGKSRRS